MSLSAELRWFWPYPAPREIANWFRSAERHQHAPSAQRLQTEHYFLRERCAQWSIRRHVGSEAFEIKVLLDSVEEGFNVGPFTGDVELWLTQSSAGPVPTECEQVDVTCRRWLRLYDTSGPAVSEVRLGSGPATPGVSQIATPHCWIDYSEIDLGLGEQWVSVGFKAGGGVAESLRDGLLRTAERLSDGRPPAMSGALTASYPQWLSDVRAFWRQIKPSRGVPLTPRHRVEALVAGLSGDDMLHQSSLGRLPSRPDPS